MKQLLLLVVGLLLLTLVLAGIAANTLPPLLASHPVPPTLVAAKPLPLGIWGSDSAILEITASGAEFTRCGGALPCF